MCGDDIVITNDLEFYFGKSAINADKTGGGSNLTIVKLPFSEMFLKLILFFEI